MERTYTRKEIEKALAVAEKGVMDVARLLITDERAIIKSSLISYASILRETLFYRKGEDE